MYHPDPKTPVMRAFTSFEKKRNLETTPTRESGTPFFKMVKKEKQIPSQFPPSPRSAKALC